MATAPLELPEDFEMYVRIPGWARNEPVPAVPYFAWANRGPGEMAVWLPVAR